jgi:uncharacterized protein (DUF2236 family)
LINNLIRKTIREMVGGSGGPPVAFLEPKGDAGLFGPESIAWKVHADFVSMMIGGISSLVLQAMHPRALAGVWDHSTFRDDLTGRLGRTAFFIASTTYGSNEMALRSINKVNAIHQHITGQDEFGRPYSATDPELLAWVHITETFSFLNGYQKYCQPKLTPTQQDQYFKEMKRLGEMMGAHHLPATLAETECAIQSYLPELHYGARAQSIVNLLDDFPTSALSKPLLKLISKAGFYNLPEWAFEKIKQPIPGPIQRALVSSAVDLIAIPIRDALKDGVAAHARRRVGVIASHEV